MNLRNSLIAVALTLAYTVSIYAPALADADGKLRQAVQQLGLSADASAGFDLLAQEPREAVSMLVSELHSIPRGHYTEGKKTPAEKHIVGCLRALHYLTGVTYSAPSRAKLTADEKQFLDFDKQMHDSNPDHKLHFFGVWMSRNADYLAPVDAQKEIIKAWRRFQATQGASFTYKPSRPAKDCMDDWFWFGLVAHGLGKE